MSLFQWPFKRKEYPGVGNPRFVSDVVAANEAVLDGLKAITGLGSVGFAIISGLDFILGSPNTYTAGTFYLNGTFYYMPNSFAEGLYLAPNPTDTMAQPFEDGNRRQIYTLLTGQSTASSAGASPVFNGNMNTYRYSLGNLKSQILSIASTIATLGSAAFRNVGTTTGTVAAGDDLRFGYTKTEADNKFAQIVNVLDKANTAVYNPSDAYNPATKKYADEASGFKLLWVGNISSDGATISKQGPTTGGLSITAVDKLTTGGYRVYHNTGNTNIFVTGVGHDANKYASPRSIQNLDASTFEVWVSDDGSGNDANFQIAIFQFY